MRTNLVWIELEKPKDNTHAEHVCRLANNMLRRLAEKATDMGGQEFFWSRSEQSYCYGGDMGYSTLSDHGKWFNLDYLGREP